MIIGVVKYLPTYLPKPSILPIHADSTSKLDPPLDEIPRSIQTTIQAAFIPSPNTELTASPQFS